MDFGFFKRAGGGFLAIAACLILSSLIFACADSAMSCEFDSNCAHGELCVESFCADPCTSDQQCDGNQTCQAFIREDEADQVLVCMFPFASNEEGMAGSMQCRDDAECREQLGSAYAVCGLNRRCVLPDMTEGVGSPEAETRYDSVLIRDLTGRALVDEQEHPGTVLSAVFVRDAVGSIVGYGDTLAFVSGADDGLPGHLDGQSVALDESGQCVAGAGSDVSALGGEGGYYLVSFVDYQGERLWLGAGWKVIVIAWGGECGEYGDMQDAGEYELSLCVSEEGEVNNIETDCSQIRERVSGYTEFLVTSNE